MKINVMVSMVGGDAVYIQMERQNEVSLDLYAKEIASGMVAGALVVQDIDNVWFIIPIAQIRKVEIDEASNA